MTWHFSNQLLPEQGVDVVACVGNDWYKLRYRELFDIKGWFRFCTVEEDEFFCFEIGDVDKWMYVFDSYRGRDSSNPVKK